MTRGHTAVALEVTVEDLEVYGGHPRGPRGIRRWHSRSPSRYTAVTLEVTLDVTLEDTLEDTLEVADQAEQENRLTRYR